MTIEAAIYSRFQGHAGIGALAGDRLYPLIAPQNAALPHVVYQRISSGRVNALSADTDMAEPRYQFKIYDTTYSGVNALATQVRLAFQRWKGTEAGITIDDSYIENDQDDYDADTFQYVVIMDFIIKHRE